MEPSTSTSHQRKLEKQRTYQRRYRAEGREKVWRRNMATEDEGDKSNTQSGSGRRAKYITEDERKAARKQQQREYACRKQGFQKYRELESGDGDIEDNLNDNISDEILSNPDIEIRSLPGGTLNSSDMQYEGEPGM